LDGSFRTSQAEYLYGMDAGRWAVVRGGVVHEVVGDRSQAGKIAAMALSQNFSAKRVLVIGQGLSVCERFLKAPSVESVDWLDPDSEYTPAVLTHAPQEFDIRDPRFHCLAGDVRAILADRMETYDVVVVNLPRVIESSLHRFMSAEFFDEVKRSLRPLGVVVVGIVGDRNAAGGGPSHQGAWVESTLRTVFSQTIVVPDESRTFFVSAAEACLQVFPVMLQTRFSLIENAGEIFPVESLEQVYRPDLSVKTLESYDAVEVPAERLVNHDDKPNHRLINLLQATSRSGVSLDRSVGALSRGGLLVVVVPILLLAIVRLAYVIRTAPRARAGGDLSRASGLQSDVLFISGVAFAVAVAGVIVLTDAWLLDPGWEPSYVGLVFSLFGLGLALGATCARWAVSLLHSQAPSHLRPVLGTFAAILAIQGAVLIVAMLAVERSATGLTLMILLALDGFPAGAAVALAAKILEGCSDSEDSSSTRLIGRAGFGAAGGCLAALFLIPLLGPGDALFIVTVTAFAIAILAAGAQYELSRPGSRIVPHRALTPIGYGLFDAALSIVAGSHILAYAERSQAGEQATAAIQDWIQGRKLSARTVASADSGKGATYHEVREGSQLKGYIFRSEDFSGTVYGYGGPMGLVMFADPGGNLIDFRITRSYETPRYISRIRSWMDSLKGRRVFGPAPMQGVNAVSGATKSCDAILRLLRNSGGKFDASVLSGRQAVEATGEKWFERVDWLVVYWAAGIAMSLIVIRHGRLWSRIAMLAFTAAVGGIWLNRQYSTDHVMRLLNGQGVLGSPIAGACLLIGTPVVILLLGNIYCGYLCPFGAVQELLGFILPKRFKGRPRHSTVTAARFIKYGVLFSLVVVFFVAGSKRFLELDPLTLVFSRQFWSEGLLASPGLILAVGVLLAAPWITRVWCRYLCPTGAFLSLFNLGGWLGRFLPAKKFGRCEFGLTGRDHLDCIHCDRCRYDNPLLPTRGEANARTRTAGV
ncbi:MAG: 4Fe-4S binding protein, partial [Phycisphaerales bacterium]